MIHSYCLTCGERIPLNYMVENLHNNLEPEYFLKPEYYWICTHCGTKQNMSEAEKKNVEDLLESLDLYSEPEPEPEPEKETEKEYIQQTLF